jgi:hypothetical protein
MICNEELTALSTEGLEREITELGGHINAATARWLALVGEFDRRQGWAEWGCRSCAHWLSYRCGVSPAAAREQVRVARRVAELPKLQAAFARGELCYSQVRAVTRVATPDTEADLLEIALHATASQLETIVRAYRGVLEVELGDDSEQYRRRFVRCEHDDDGALLIQARLPAEEGALVLRALEASREALRTSRGVPGEGGASAEIPQIGDATLSGADGRELGEGGGLDEEGELDAETVERFTPSNADALMLMAQTALAHGRAGGAGGDIRSWCTWTPPRSPTTRTAPANSSTARRWRRRRPGGSAATPAWSGSSNATAARCQSGARPEPFHRRSSERYGAATEPAASPAAASTASCTRTTSGTGHRAAAPTSPT